MKFINHFKFFEDFLAERCGVVGNWTLISFLPKFEHYLVYSWFLFNLIIFFSVFLSPFCCRLGYYWVGMVGLQTLLRNPSNLANLRLECKENEGKSTIWRKVAIFYHFVAHKLLAEFRWFLTIGGKVQDVGWPTSFIMIKFGPEFLSSIPEVLSQFWLVSGFFRVLLGHLY